MRHAKSTLLLLFLSILAFSLRAQPKPPSAEKVINEAKAEATQTHKNIFIIFHASWCVWCHRMDTAMNDQSITSFFDNNYVIKHLDVDEVNDKRYLENPGAAALLNKYHGDQQGIPYWLILDRNGKLLADSRVHSDDGKVTGNNVGCPVKPDEVAYFIKVLKKTSHVSDSQLEMIRKRFLKIGE